MTKATVYVYAYVKDGRVDYTVASTWQRSDAQAISEDGTASVLVKTIELDTSDYDCDPVEVAAQMYLNGITKAREKFAATVKLYQDQHAQCLALPAPNTIDA